MVLSHSAHVGLQTHVAERTLNGDLHHAIGGLDSLSSCHGWGAC